MILILALLILVSHLQGDVFEWELELGRVGSTGELVKALEGKGIEVSGIFQPSQGYSYLFICGDGWVRKVIADMPQIATFYICRVYIYRDREGKIRVGYVNMENLIKVFGRYLSPESRKILADIFSRVRSAVEEVGKR